MNDEEDGGKGEMGRNAKIFTFHAVRGAVFTKVFEICVFDPMFCTLQRCRFLFLELGLEVWGGHFFFVLFELSSYDLGCVELIWVFGVRRR